MKNCKEISAFEAIRNHFMPGQEITTGMLIALLQPLGFSRNYASVLLPNAAVQRSHSHFYPTMFRRLRRGVYTLTEHNV